MKSKLTIKTKSVTECPVCNSKEFHLDMKSEDFETGSGVYEILKCESCSASFTNPQPLLEDIPKLYENRDTADFPPMSKFAMFLRIMVIKPLVFHLTRDLNKNKDSAEKISILDYACGDGLLSYVAKKYSPQSTVFSADFQMNPPPLIEEQNDIKYIDFESLKNSSQKFDLIICRHVIEHVIDPHEFIQELKSKLNEKGKLFLEFPNYDSLWRRILGKYFFGLYVPRHILHYNPQSTSCLFSMHFKKFKIKKKHTPIIGRSLGYIFNKNIGNLGIIGLLTYPIQIVLDILTGKSTTIQIECRNSPQ